VPQIVGILFGYVWIAGAMKGGALRSPWMILILMAAVTALFIFNEMNDLMRERIAHFRKGDFYSAMRVCGISRARIVNFHILWKNSRMHVFNKLISVFGMAVFLQCSVSFIISVGLSTEVDLITLPSTLGSVLAQIDSKQDILAVGYALTHPSHFPQMFFRHLQGLTTAFVMVFSLLCIHRIATGFAERHRL
jgi:ABC-type dipeptide/oligopeptide/nickel transport system permease subunit